MNIGELNSQGCVLCWNVAWHIGNQGQGCITAGLRVKDIWLSS